MSIMQIKDGIRVSEISRDEVAHLAKLSRLALSEEELAQFATQIDEIVDSVSAVGNVDTCLLYTSPSPRDLSTSRMPSSA